MLLVTRPVAECPVLDEADTHRTEASTAEQARRRGGGWSGSAVSVCPSSSPFCRHLVPVLSGRCFVPVTSRCRLSSVRLFRRSRLCRCLSSSSHTHLFFVLEEEGRGANRRSEDGMYEWQRDSELCVGH